MLCMRWIALAVAAALLLSLSPLNAAPSGVKVVVTFNNLLYDLKLITCPSDYVDYLVQQGLDPHDYELRPGDLDKLRRADLIVSTGHTPFETEIRGMISRAEIKAKLIEIPGINGILIYKNPMTDQPNYHMPIYDPENYLTFMRELRDVLSELNPSCSKTYEENYERIESNLRELMRMAGAINATALISVPSGQYALEWLGVRVKYLLMKEEGLPATPSDLSEIYRAAKEGRINLVVTVGDEKAAANRKAIEISEEFGIKRVNIPSPLDPGSMMDKLRIVTQSLEGNIGIKSESSEIIQVIPYAVLIAALTLVVLAYLLRRR